MKNFKKGLLLATLIIAVVIGITSCENNTKDVAEDHNDEKFDENENEKPNNLW